MFFWVLAASVPNPPCGLRIIGPSLGASGTARCLWGPFVSAWPLCFPSKTRNLVVHARKNSLARAHPKEGAPSPVPFFSCFFETSFRPSIRLAPSLSTLEAPSCRVLDASSAAQCGCVDPEGHLALTCLPFSWARLIFVEKPPLDASEASSLLLLGGTALAGALGSAGSLAEPVRNKQSRIQTLKTRR